MISSSGNIQAATMEYPVLLLGEQLQMVEDRLAAFLQKCDEDFVWADEVLAACKATFTSKEIELMPKTPSFKKPTRRVGRKKKVLEDEEDCVEPPLRNRRGRKAAVEESASPLTTRSGRPMRSTRASRASTRSSTASTQNSNMSTQVTHSTRTSRSTRQSQMESDESLAGSPVYSTSSAASRQSKRGAKKDLDSNTASNGSMRSTKGTRTSRRKQQSQTESAPPSPVPSSASKARSSKAEAVETSTPQASTQERQMTPVPAFSPSLSKMPGTPGTVKREGFSSLENCPSTIKRQEGKDDVPDEISTPIPHSSSVPITPPILTRAASRMTRVMSPVAASASPVTARRSSRSSHQSALGGAHQSPRVVSTKARRTSSTSGPRVSVARKASDGERSSLKSQKRSGSLKGGKEEVDKKPNRTKLCLQKNAAKRIAISSDNKSPAPSSSSSETSTLQQPAVSTSAETRVDTQTSTSSKNNAHSTRTKTRNAERNQAEVNATAVEEVSHIEEKSRFEEPDVGADAQVPEDVGGTPSKRRKLNKDLDTKEQFQEASRMEPEEAKTAIDRKEPSPAEDKSIMDDTSSKCRTRTKAKQQDRNVSTVSSNSVESSASAESGRNTRSKTRNQAKNPLISIKMEASFSASTSTIADDDKEEKMQHRARTKTLKTTATAGAENASMLSEGSMSSAAGQKETATRTKTRTKTRMPAAAAETTNLVSENSTSSTADQREEASTRTKTRMKTPKPAANPSYVIPVINASSDEDDRTEKPMRQSQRTKTRKSADSKVASQPVQEEKEQCVRQTEESMDSGILSTQPSCEDLLKSQEDQETKRVTRTKTRKPNTTAGSVSADNGTASQSTRTKTRKRQAEESEQDLPPLSKRSCTAASFTKDPFPCTVDRSGSFVERLPTAGMSHSTQTLLLCRQSSPFQEWVLLRNQPLHSLPQQNLEAVLPSRRQLSLRLLALRPQENPELLLLSSASAVMDVRAYLSKADLQVLMNKALAFRTGRGYHGNRIHLPHFFRNRWTQYFDDIFNRNGGLMETYAKDANGDPDSAINGNISGLFFSPALDHQTNRPPTESYFGEKRLMVAADILFRDDSRLYFADFYCHYLRAHYVTLVMTRRGSQTDQYCENRLIELNLQSNPFLTREPATLFRPTAMVYTTLCDKMHIEVLYTEHVHITQLQQLHGSGQVYMTNCATRGRGRSIPQGIPKNSSCPTCNLPRE